VTGWRCRRGATRASAGYPRDAYRWRAPGPAAWAQVRRPVQNFPRGDMACAASTRRGCRGPPAGRLHDGPCCWTAFPPRARALSRVLRAGLRGDGLRDCQLSKVGGKRDADGPPRWRRASPDAPTTVSRDGRTASRPSVKAGARGSEKLALRRGSGAWSPDEVPRTAAKRGSTSRLAFMVSARELRPVARSLLGRSGIRPSAACSRARGGAQALAAHEGEGEEGPTGPAHHCSMASGR